MRLFRHSIVKPLLLLAAAEFLVLLLAALLALGLAGEPALAGRGPFAHRAIAALAAAAIAWIGMAALALYHRTVWRDRRRVARSSALACGIGFASVADPTAGLNGAALLPAVGVPLAVGGVCALRALFASLARAGRFRRDILVVGTGARAARLATAEQPDPALGFRALGFVALAGGDPSAPCVPVLKPWPSLRDLACALGVREIVIAPDDPHAGLPVEDLVAARLANVVVSDLERFWEREFGCLDLESLQPEALIFAEGFPGGVLHLVMKRLFDVTVATALLLFSLPVLLGVAATVRLSGPGPVLYRQERVGRHGRPFTLLKFRSMRLDAERDGTPQWARTDDARVTPVGRFIRKVRFDELPQLFNVLRGDMSFIGPRPERPYFVELLTREIGYYGLRHQVKPGLTGWAQVNYPYGASVDDARRKLEYELYYIKNSSLFLDLVVMVETVPVVLWPDGAR